MGVKQIICAVDFSDHSEKTLAYAASLAATHGADLKVVHVIDHLHGFDNFQILALGPDEIAAKLETDAKEKLETLLSNIGGEVATKTVAVVGHGKASAQIIETAEKESADLIVIGSHGRSGLKQLFVGSVAEAVVRGAGCAVLVVK